MVDKYLISDFSELSFKTKKRDKTGCWIIDYTPTISNLLFPKEFVKKLKIYFQKDPTQQFNKLDIPNHILLNGPYGCGKWTIIRAIINDFYAIDLDNTSISRVEEELKPDGTPTKENAYYFIKYYNTPFNLIYYINIATLKAKDIRHFISFISDNIKIKTTKKIFIIRRLDLLDSNTQNILGFILEKYYRRILLIATTHTMSQILSPKIKTLTYKINMKCMTELEFSRFNTKLSTKHKYTLANELAYKYYTENRYNLRNTILQIQTHIQKTKQYETPFEKQVAIDLLNIISTKSYNSYMLMREKLYTSLAIGISSRSLLQNTISILLKNKHITSDMKLQSIKLAAQSDHSLCNCDREIFPMEQFYAELMTIIK